MPFYTAVTTEQTYSATSGGIMPLMIAETAAVGADQAPWIWGFSEKHFAATFPAIKAVNYFDAPNYKKQRQWQLRNRGLAALTKLGPEALLEPHGLSVIRCHPPVTATRCGHA